MSGEVVEYARFLATKNMIYRWRNSRQILRPHSAPKYRVVISKIDVFWYYSRSDRISPVVHMQSPRLIRREKGRSRVKLHQVDVYLVYGSCFLLVRAESPAFPASCLTNRRAPQNILSSSR
jgi:hypothetical protein